MFRFDFKKISLLFNQHIVEQVLSIQIIKGTHCFFFMLHNNFRLLIKHLTQSLQKIIIAGQIIFLTVILFSTSQKCSH